jgi:membrane-bound inhibitor of C-type lysozyme
MLAAIVRRSSRMRVPSTFPHRAAAALLLSAAVAVAAGCSNTPSKEEQEVAKNTFACQLNGERIVIRFDSGEARLLMPGGDRVVLYQIAAASGVRYTNGTLELRGKGMELQLISDGNLTPLGDCQPYVVPK